MNLFGRRKKGPDRAFSHSETCKIQAADPTVLIEWSELERGHWRAICVCGTEDYYEPVADRVRLDPYDPSTFRHAGQCEHRHTSDPALLRAILKTSCRLLDANETTVPFDFHDPTGAAIDKAIRPARAGQRGVPDRAHGGASTPPQGVLDPTEFEVDQVVL